MKVLPANSAPREETPSTLPIRIKGVRWSKVPWHVLLLGVGLLLVGLAFQRAMSDAEGGVGIAIHRGHSNGSRFREFDSIAHQVRQHLGNCER